MQTVHKSSNRRVNKSAWVRAQPSTMKTKELIEAAKKEGIHLTPSNVYVARSEDKRRKPETAAAAPGQTRRLGVRISATTQSSDPDLKLEFQRLAVRIGTDESQLLLNQIVTGEFTALLH